MSKPHRTNDLKVAASPIGVPFAILFVVAFLFIGIYALFAFLAVFAIVAIAHHIVNGPKPPNAIR